MSDQAHLLQRINDLHMAIDDLCMKIDDQHMMILDLEKSLSEAINKINRLKTGFCKLTVIPSL